MAAAIPLRETQLKYPPADPGVTSGIGIAAGTLPLGAAASEGTLILAYLLAVDHTETCLTGRQLRWARGQVGPWPPGLLPVCSPLGVAAATVPPSPWLALAGAAAAAAALLVAAV